MSTNLNYLDGLLKQLLKSKHNNYSEECICTALPILAFYLDEDKYIIEDLNHIHNKWDEKLKCTLIRHRGSKGVRNSELGINSKCIVYLHGLGSSRLESLNIVQHLPQNYCICMFDMSGSGKSQGEFVTYGMKESEDLDPIINYLHKKKYIREFVLWGRSMGAVATLLFAIQHHKQTGSNQRSRGILTANNSLRNSIVSTIQFQDESLVKGIILDSPFHNFRDIAKQIATNKLSIPNFIVQVALSYVQSSFARILQERIGGKYNPFNIDFSQDISLNIPIIFLYSQKDEIVPSFHSERIIKNIKTKFQKLLINECNHNESRPAKVINQIFVKLEKFTRAKNYQNKKLSQSMSKDVTLNTSCDKKRGIFVYTPSREKQCRTIEYQQENQGRLKKHSTIEIPAGRCESILHSPKEGRSQIRRSRISLQASKIATIYQEYQDKLYSNIATIDSETNNIITKKLTGIRQSQAATRKLRSRRFNMQRRMQVKLTHHKYLQ